MIKNLHIENYALIEHLDIDLHAGFSVITGETGAGKSIILGAIGLLLGQRADTKSIKQGAKRCVIEAHFDLSRYGFDDFFTENDLDFDGSECIIRRELTAAGKSRAFINDTPAPLTLLRELGEQLIDVHSQHQNLLLGKENFQLSILDIIGANKQLVTDYQKQYHALRTLQRELEEARIEAQRNRDDEDFLRFQSSQLEEASLRDGEQEELEEESEMLSHAEDIKEALYRAQGILTSDDCDNAIQQVKSVISSLRSVSNMLKPAEELIERLESTYIELKDIADEIDTQSDRIEFNPQRLEFVNERLNTIYSLQQKHHTDTIAGLLAIQASIDERLMQIDNSDDHIEELQARVNEQHKAVMATARTLSEKRKAAAAKVESEMTNRLLPLGMPNVQFHVETEQTDTLTANGLDKVTFLFSANKNATLKDVAQVASGGEIARVMLSLKALIAGAVKLPTIVFDEIDTGVSGSIAEKMARIMREMGDNNRQVISITHLPQIAAMGSAHYKVYKEDNDEETISHIIELDRDQRVTELAHMLSGENITDAALQNARSLLQ